MYRMYVDIGAKDGKERLTGCRPGLHKSQGTGFYKDDKTGKLFREEVARMPIMDGINDQAVTPLKHQ